MREVGEKCIAGIMADPDQCRQYAEKSIGLATALSSVLGYQAAVEIAQEAVRQNKTLLEILTEKNLFTREEITGLLDPIRMTEPKPPKKKK